MPLGVAQPRLKRAEKVEVQQGLARIVSFDLQSMKAGAGFNTRPVSRIIT